jgi:hypothetical protein
MWASALHWPTSRHSRRRMCGLYLPRGWLALVTRRISQVRVGCLSPKGPKLQFPEFEFGLFPRPLCSMESIFPEQHGYPAHRLGHSVGQQLHGEILRHLGRGNQFLSHSQKPLVQLRNIGQLVHVECLSFFQCPQSRCRRGAEEKDRNERGFALGVVGAETRGRAGIRVRSRRWLGVGRKLWSRWGGAWCVVRIRTNVTSVVGLRLSPVGLSSSLLAPRVSVRAARIAGR